MAYGKHKQFYSTSAWTKTRQYVLARDNYICQLCGYEGYIVHHIVWINQNNVDDMNITINSNNLITLCHTCHNAIHLNTEEEQEQSFDSFGNLLKPKEKNKKINKEKLNLLKQQLNPNDF